MNKAISPTILLSIVVALLLSLTACAKAPPPVDPSYLAEVESWRADRLARLIADDGWLTLTGLYWLEPGENTFGSGGDNAIVLPDESIPRVAGQLVLGEDGVVTALAADGAQVFVNGEPLTRATLTTDLEGSPDVVTAGRIQFYVIDREGRLAARVKDPEAATRTAFTGIEYFPIDPAFRAKATLEPYDTMREVAVPTVLGQDASFVAPGLLHFSINGKEYTLEPFLDGPDNDSYFIIFRDATSGVTSYGAGRFLSAAAAGEEGTTVLDFNLAYNPPCAFTPFATCPLPPQQNWLGVAIEAGEKYSGTAH